MWTRAAVALAVAWLLLHEARVLFAPDADLGPLTSRFAHDVVLALASVLCLRGALRAREGRVAWLLVAAGVASWTLGELYFTAVLWDLDDVPIPSPADVGYLGYLVLALAGIVALLVRRARHTPGTLWADGLIAGLAATALNAALVLEPVLEHLPDEPAGIVVNLAYAVGDLVLFGVLVGALASTGWRADRRWLLLAGGVSVFWIADSLYLVETAQGTYVSGYSWYEAGWWVGLGLIAAASWLPWDRPVEAAEPEGLRFILMPLGSGVVGLGLLVWGCFTPLNPIAVTLAALSLVAVMGRLVLTFRQNVAMVRASRDEASTDPLTGLGNRRALTRELERRLPAASEARPLTLVLLDLDGFKAYNDRFGHPAGDALLVRLAARLAARVGQGCAFRLGGDEFCVLHEGAVAGLVEDASAALSETGEGFEVTCSHGAISLPEEAGTAPDALRIADERLYADKHGGRRRRGAAGRGAAASSAEMVAVASALAALTSAGALAPEDALRELQAGAGGVDDPALVEAFWAACRAGAGAPVAA